MILVGLVSPNPALRAGLRLLLEASADIQVVAELPDLQQINPETEVLVLASVSPLDLQALDAGFPAVLLLSDDGMDLRQLAASGVVIWGALPASAGEAELAAAVRALVQGLWVGAPELLQDIMQDTNRLGLMPESLEEPLTPREIEVLELVAQGLANKQVALVLDISEHTVKFHLSSIYTKLGASSRTEAIRLGVHKGLITL